MTSLDLNIEAPSLVRKLLRAFGIDRAVGYTVGGRIWSVLAGPVNLILIARHLSPSEQGFYYTFASVLGMQIFFELGVTYVIQQFASHEMASLVWNEERGVLEGEDVAKARLASLVRKALGWYGVAALLMTIALLVWGGSFFARHGGTAASWRAPWSLVVVIAGLSLFVTPMFSILEGCGKVAEVARVRALQGMVSSIACWTSLILGLRLFASAALSGTTLLIGAAWLLLTRRAFISDLVRTRSMTASVSWVREVWPFQWRIALSWVSGYFIFQLFNPILFAYHGPAAAGRMGMSMSISQALMIVSMSWLAAKAPLFGQHVARRDWSALDAAFFPTMWRSVAVVGMGGAAAITGLALLRWLHHPFGNRLIATVPFSLLILATLANTIVIAESLYLRAHKREPFLAMSVANALLVGGSAWLIGRTSAGENGMVIAYAIITMVASLGIGTLIFIRKRHEWHQETALEVLS